MSFPFSGDGRRGALVLLLGGLALPTLAHAQQALGQQVPVPSAPTSLAPVVVTAPSGGGTVPEVPAGVTITRVEREVYKNSPAFSAGQVLQYSPGVTIKQGNGPRDVGISIRGSNARNGFGVRNIQVMEDGFPVTQPDGLSRTDLTDPHAYGGIDVFRGPNSALYGNYATGGAINFRSRTGRELQGGEVGLDAGSFGYLNAWGAYGQAVGAWDAAGFASHARGDGFIRHSGFDTTTENILVSWTPTADDKLTFKLVNNDIDASLPIRLSLNQYRQNPFQRGCVTASAATVAAGCGTVSLFNNGVSGASTAQTADQAGLRRTDRRTIVGSRWEHSWDSATVGRVQFTFDNREISQPTGSTSAEGVFPSYNLVTDVTRSGSLFGLDATHYAALTANYQEVTSYSYNVAPGGNARLGALSSAVRGHQANYGGRIREEVRLAPGLTGVLGVGAEYSDLDAAQQQFLTPVPIIKGQRGFFNVAPEAGLLWRVAPEWLLRGRVATGYGTPQTGNLFITPQGVAGNNTQLQPQRNVGIDLGTDWTPTRDVLVGVTGFYEFYENELVSQSPGAGLQSFTFNAPASQHRGVEVFGDWRPRPGWLLRVAWTYNDQYYTGYTEQLSAGTRTARFSRAGNKLPGVEPNALVARLGYDQPDGPLAGLGGFFEVAFKDEYFIDNANLVKVPSYELLTLNLHYDPSVRESWLKGLTLFFEIQNLLNETYVASANNVANSLNAATGLQNAASTVAAAGGSIYAGAPRTFVGGLRLRF